MSISTRFFAVLATIAAATLALIGFATAAAAYPPGQSGVLGVSTSRTSQDCSITVSGQNFKGSVSLTSGSVDLGSATADSSGNFSKSVQISSDDFSTGDHSITASDSYGDNETITVHVSAAGNSCSDGEALGAGTSNSGSGGGTANTGVAVASIGGVGLVLLAGGALLLYTGRRRRVTA